VAKQESSEQNHLSSTHPAKSLLLRFNLRRQSPNLVV